MHHRTMTIVRALRSSAPLWIIQAVGAGLLLLAALQGTQHPVFLWACGLLLIGSATHIRHSGRYPIGRTDDQDEEWRCSTEDGVQAIADFFEERQRPRIVRSNRQ